MMYKIFKPFDFSIFSNTWFFKCSCVCKCIGFIIKINFNGVINAHVSTNDFIYECNQIKTNGAYIYGICWGNSDFGGPKIKKYNTDLDLVETIQPAYTSKISLNELNNNLSVVDNDVFVLVEKCVDGSGQKITEVICDDGSKYKFSNKVFEYRYVSNTFIRKFI